MKLSEAVKFIVDLKGKNVVNHPLFLNALNDCNAFEENIAYKNIVRILFNDGFIDKIVNHNTDIPSLSHEIEKYYLWDKSHIDYLIKCIQYGLCITSEEPKLHIVVENAPTYPTTSCKNPIKHISYKDLSTEDKEKHLKSLVKIKNIPGCKIQIYSIEIDVLYNGFISKEIDDNLGFQIVYNVRKTQKIDDYQYKIQAAAYDKKGTLLVHNYSYFYESLFFENEHVGRIQLKCNCASVNSIVIKVQKEQN